MSAGRNGGGQFGGGAVHVEAIRVGQGFDIHRFSDDPARPLVLGGVTFAGERGLVGHSDADAVAHAVADALLGAAGLGDIGEHFPDTDERWRGVDSLVLLAVVADELRAAGWRVGNVDCAVVCERPKLATQRAEMQRRLSAAAGGQVTVKGRRAEGLGALGRSEGIACWAAAVIVAADDDLRSEDVGDDDIRDDDIRDDDVRERDVRDRDIRDRDIRDRDVRDREDRESDVRDREAGH